MKYVAFFSKHSSTSDAKIFRARMGLENIHLQSWSRHVGHDNCEWTIMQIANQVDIRENIADSKKGHILFEHTVIDQWHIR